MATRLWCPDPYWNAGDDWIQFKPITHPKASIRDRFSEGFRLSLFWSLFISIDAVIEVEVDDHTLESSFWSPTDLTWGNTSHIFGFRVCHTITPKRIIGWITDNSVEQIFKNLERLHMEMLVNSKHFPQGAAAYLTYSRAIEVLNQAVKEKYEFASYERHQRLEIALNRLVTARQYANAEWIMDRKKQRCYPHLMGAFMRPQIHNFLEAYRWLNEDKVSLPATEGSKNDKEVLKQYREAVNNVVLNSLES